MTHLRQKTAPIREKRVGSIGAFSGKLSALLREAESGDIPQRVRTFAQDVPSDLQYALDLLGTLDGVSLVVHGPAGCASALNRSDAAVRKWAVTNVSERDSILGGDQKLRRAIEEVHAAHSPRAILVVATPVVSINNDDIESVTEELKDELGIPVIPVYADGFRSKLGTTGYDVVAHALIKHLVPKRPRLREERVNLLAVAESAANVESLRGLLDELALHSQSFPRYASVAETAWIGEAGVSVSVDPDDADYVGHQLEQSRGVPYLKLPTPLGIAATSAWIEAVGEATGRAEQARLLAIRHSQHLAGLLAGTAGLKGVRTFVNLPVASAIAFSRLAQEIGLTIVGFKVSHVAPRHAGHLRALLDEHGDLPVLVGDGQVFEEANVLRDLKPELYVGSGNAAVHALLEGIPVLDLAHVPSLGYAGVEAIVERLQRTLGNTGFLRFLAEGDSSAYLSGWLGKSAHWFIKHEVK